MTVNLVLITRATPLISSTSAAQSSDQSRSLHQYKLSVESQLLASYLLLHYDHVVEASHLEGTEDAIELREYEIVHRDVPSQATFEGSSLFTAEPRRLGHCTDYIAF